MYQGRTISRKTIKLHERCLRITYNEKSHRSVSIHMSNIHSLVIEMFCVCRNQSTPIINDILK